MKKYVEAEEIQLVFSGKNYFEVLEQIIDGSKESLHLQTYIFNTDETGLRILEALKRAAARHVKVSLMPDAYGSFPFPGEIATALKEAGIQFRLYSPLFSSESRFFARRLHHKIVVADKFVGLIGGINIANKYNSNTSDEAWLDYAVLMKGEVCEYLHLLCEQFYKKHKSTLADEWESKYQDKDVGHSSYIRFRRNDWINGKNEIHKSYLEGLIKAEKSIIIVASYFLPGRTFRKLMRAASKRGVDIKVILSGKSDVTSASFAERYLYDFYLGNNVRLYEWNNSVMHGKAMVIDDTWATVGSYNLNFLSHYVSIELNADIIDGGFIGAFSAHLREIIQTSCTEVDLNIEKRKKNIFRRFIRWLAYNFYRILMIIAMTAKKHRKQSKQNKWTR